MQFNAVALASILATLANGAVVNFYSNSGCQNYYGQRNIYDNTCATGVGSYASFMIVTAGGQGQGLTPYNRDACAGPTANYVDATQTGTCFELTDTINGWNGNANAMASN